MVQRGEYFDENWEEFSFGIGEVKQHAFDKFLSRFGAEEDWKGGFEQEAFEGVFGWDDWIEIELFKLWWNWNDLCKSGEQAELRVQFFVKTV